MFINRDEKEYKKVHLLSKIIVCVFNTILLYIITLVGVNGISILIVLTVYNASYFFGVNTVSYIIETIRGTKHLHDKL